MVTTIVMPAYNAAATLEHTFNGLPAVHQTVILCDDASQDDTARVSRKLGIDTITHAKNRGYGGNQKSLYARALESNPQIVVMVHPDNQYDTSCLPEMIDLIASGKADLVLGNRMKTARQNGMPLWKYLSNRSLTVLQNAVYGTRLDEFHSGLRAYRADLIAEMPYQEFSEDFVFDSEVLAWAIANGHIVGQVDTQCFYNGSVSSINLRRSLRYGLSTLSVLWRFKKGAFLTPPAPRATHTRTTASK